MTGDHYPLISPYGKCFCPVCASNENTPLDPDPKIDREAKRLARLIYNGKLKEGDIDPKLTILVAEKLKEAILEGYGINADEIKYDTADYNMLKNLEKNVYAFSAAKNFQQLKEMNMALKDEEGNIRSFSNFRKISQSINYQYNHDWLETEYNTAINSATMASRWTDFEQNKKIMPLLEYKTAGDDRVREAHQVLDGVKKDMDDPFWDTYYPPNGFNCRCTVIQITSGIETPDQRIRHPEVPKMFQTNLAKQGLVFPDDHPYYDGVPKEVIESVKPGK